MKKWDEKEKHLDQDTISEISIEEQKEIDRHTHETNHKNFRFITWVDGLTREEEIKIKCDSCNFEFICHSNKKGNKK